MAIILALMAMLLMSTLGTAVILTTSTESVIAVNFRNAQEGLYAADASLELAIADLDAQPDWNAVLDGQTPSVFVDGPPLGSRRLSDDAPLDLGQMVTVLNSAQRPWGPNNPVWRLFVYGPLSALFPDHPIDSAFYVVVMVADDPAENDDDPLRDGHTAENAGSGVLVLRAEAFGPRGTHQAVEATIARPATQPLGARLLSWRQVR